MPFASFLLVVDLGVEDNEILPSRTGIEKILGLFNRNEYTVFFSFNADNYGIVLRGAIPQPSPHH